MNDETLAYFLIIAIGVGYLFPLSALTQPIDYWHFLFPTINIEFPMTTLYMWVNLLVLGGIVFLRQKSSTTFRIVGGFLGQFVVLLAVPNLQYLGLSPDAHYVCVMFATAVAAAATALIDSVAIGFAAQYPKKVLEGLQFGIGLSTLIGSVYRVFTKAIFLPSQIIESSLLYFYVGAFTIFLCILSYYYLLSLPLSQRIKEGNFPALGRSRDMKEEGEESIQLLEPGSCRSIADYATLEDGTKEVSDDRKKQSKLTGLNNKNQEIVKGSRQQLEPSWSTKMIILKKVAFQQFLVFAVFFTSLLVWPAMITEIPTYSFSYLEETKWWSLILLLMYAILDCAGRLCTSYRMGLTPQNIWVVVLLRTALIPLIIWIAQGDFLIQSDFFSVLLVSIMGLTNGYLGSLCIIMVTEDVEEEEKEIAGAFTGFFLNVGLVFGSTAALFVESFAK
jgi:equilibrative nucleoside transporter 1/2/3